MSRIDFVACTLVILAGAVSLTHAQPVNDECTTAAPLQYGVTTVGHTSSANVVPSAQASCDGGATFWRDVWHIFTPSDSGLYLIDTGGSAIEHTLSVWTNCPATNEVFCDADYCDPQHRRVVADLQAGQTYYIRIGGSQEGLYQVLVALAGDMNLDAMVGMDDLTPPFADAWLSLGCGLGDVDADPCFTHLGDFDILALQWGRSACSLMALTTSVAGGVGGTIDPAPGAYQYCDGSEVPLMAAPSAGWQIKEWTGAKWGGTDPCNTVKLLGVNKNVSVEFEPIPPDSYVLTTSVAGGCGGIQPASGPQPADGLINLTAQPCAGWRVKEWTGDADTQPGPEQNGNTVVMSADKAVAVEFECILATLTTGVINPEGGIITPEPGDYEHCVGTEVSLLADPCEGWEIKAWHGARNGGTDPCNIVTVDGDKAVSVEFARIQYLLTTVVAGGEGGQINPGTGLRDAGEVVPLLADPCAGYKETVAWDGTDNDTLIILDNTVTMNGPRNVTVTFDLVPVGPAIGRFLLEDITPLGAMGSIAFNPLGDPCDNAFAYDPCTVVSLTATPAGGYKVGSWTGPVDNPGSTALTNQVTMFGESQLIQVGATFDPDPTAAVLTLTVVDDFGGGFSSPAVTPSIRYTGEIVDLVAAPDPGWQVVAWGGDAANQPAAGSLTNTVTMNSDKEVTVEYEPTGLTVTELKVKADKDRAAPEDSFKMEAAFVGNEADLAGADSVILSISGNSWPLPYPSDMWKQKGSKYSYKNSAAKTTGGISKLVLEFTNSGICTVQAKNISLAGVQTPVEVTLQFGAFAGADLVGEDVVNGEKKLLPICLLSGVQDALEPDKAPKLKNGESISIGGGIASSDPVDLSAIDVTISWAGGAIVIPAGGFEASGDKWVAKAIQDNQGVLDVTLDFIKCDFSIKISEANALPPTGELTVSFDGFSASKTWDGAAWVD